MTQNPPLRKKSIHLAKHYCQIREKWKNIKIKSLARRLRQETTMTLNWIAERLNLGAAGSLANRLRETERKR